MIVSLITSLASRAFHSLVSEVADTDPSKPLMRQIPPTPTPIRTEFSQRMTRQPGSPEYVAPFLVFDPRARPPEKLSPQTPRNSPQSQLFGQGRGGRPVLPLIATRFSTSTTSEITVRPSERLLTATFETSQPLEWRPLTPLRRQEPVVTPRPHSPFQIIGTAEAFPVSSSTSRLRVGPYPEDRQWGPRPSNPGVRPAASGSTPSSVVGPRVRDRSASDGPRYVTRSTQQPSRIEGPQSAPMRRMFSDSPDLNMYRMQEIPQSASRQTQLDISQNHIPSHLDGAPSRPPLLSRPAPIEVPELSIDVNAPLIPLEDRRQTTPQVHERLTPVRRLTSESQETPATTPSRTPTSPFSSLLPRLTSLLRRGTFRLSPIDVPDDIYDEELAPPAYHTLSTRQSRNLRSLPPTPG